MSEERHPQAPRDNRESAWDYPRPPRVERTGKRLVIEIAGIVLADTTRGYRVLETSHPPVYYLPAVDILMNCLSPSPRRSFCEFKGYASYWVIRVGSRVEQDAAWSYERPNPGFETIRGCIAFYAGQMDACSVDGERVIPQPSDYYGGWITKDIIGPFKGGPNSRQW